MSEAAGWEPNEVLQIPVNTKKATPKAALSTFGTSPLASFDAKGIFGSAWQRLVAVSSVILLPLHFLPTHLPCGAAAPSRAPSRGWLSQGLEQRLARQQRPVLSAHNFRSCFLCTNWGRNPFIRLF